MQLDLNQEVLRAEFEAWRQSLTTQKLFASLRAVAKERHGLAIQTRKQPAIAADWLEREHRINSLIEYIQQGDFILPSNTQTLDKNL